jgi:hypothetical protein
METAFKDFQIMNWEMSTRVITSKTLRNKNEIVCLPYIFLMLPINTMFLRMKREMECVHRCFQ